jgi:hypothetical protein
MVTAESLAESFGGKFWRKPESRKVERRKVEKTESRKVEKKESGNGGKS